MGCECQETPQIPVILCIWLFVVGRFASGADGTGEQRQYVCQLLLRVHRYMQQKQHPTLAPKGPTDRRSLNMPLETSSPKKSVELGCSLTARTRQHGNLGASIQHSHTSWTLSPTQSSPAQLDSGTWPLTLPGDRETLSPILMIFLFQPQG